MWKWFYDGMELLELPIIAMGIFMLVFVVQVSRTFLRGTGDEHTAQLPLLDDATNGGES